MSYSFDHSDDDPLVQELRELIKADDAKALGYKVDEKIHLENAQFISNSQKSRFRRSVSRQKSEEKKQS